MKADALQPGNHTGDLLLLLRNTTDEAEENTVLEQLVREHAYPLIKRIVKSKLRVYSNPVPSGSGLQDAEDIIGEVELQLLRKLRRYKINSGEDSLNNFLSYVAVMTSNAFHNYLRQKYPQRWRLKNKIRYILSHQKPFAIWQEHGAQWLCGFDSWKDQHKPPCPTYKLRQSGDNSIAVEQPALLCEQTHSDSPTHLLATIFNWADAPIELDDLVHMVAGIWAIKDSASDQDDNAEKKVDRHLALCAKDLVQLDHRLYLQRLWPEICQLPLQQRRALLLNLADEQGRDMTTILEGIAIASLAEIAGVLEIPAEEFTRLWNDLPLEDAAIAKYLSITRQQVINLRSAARKRLTRHMNGLKPRRSLSKH